MWYGMWRRLELLSVTAAQKRVYVSISEFQGCWNFNSNLCSESSCRHFGTTTETKEAGDAKEMIIWISLFYVWLPKLAVLYKGRRWTWSMWAVGSLKSELIFLSIANHWNWRHNKMHGILERWFGVGRKSYCLNEDMFLILEDLKSDLSMVRSDFNGNHLSY